MVVAINGKVTINGKFYATGSGGMTRERGNTAINVEV